MSFCMFLFFKKHYVPQHYDSLCAAVFSGTSSDSKEILQFCSRAALDNLLPEVMGEWQSEPLHDTDTCVAWCASHVLTL